jgi:ethanolamine utilization protein EutA
VTTPLAFSAQGRAVGDEDELTLTSVGIDIGSSTSHLVFSRLVLKRRDSRYTVAERTVLHESAIALTPFRRDDEVLIDGAALGEFIDAQYRAAGLARSDVDTGALILTGLAVRRANAAQIGELFAAEAGRFVMVTAGDALEATMAAHGSGTTAQPGPALNVDIGGGTTKLAFCENGRVRAVTALDVGARLVVVDSEGRVARVEDAATEIARALDLPVTVGDRLPRDVGHQLVAALADAVSAAAGGTPRMVSPELVRSLLRVPPLEVAPDASTPVIFSGGVAEYVYERERARFDDLGVELAEAVRARLLSDGHPVVDAGSGIRATVLGASQYTIQVSGSTIFVDPVSALPLRNVPVVSLDIDLSAASLEADVVAADVRTALARGTGAAESAVAIALRWGGSATFARLDALAAGLLAGVGEASADVPIVVVSDGDVGGLLGMHLRETRRVPNPVVSIDGVELRDFDFVDVGELIPNSGAVPVVIKSLVFPAADAARLDDAPRAAAGALPPGECGDQETSSVAIRRGTSLT